MCIVIETPGPEVGILMLYLLLCGLVFFFIGDACVGVVDCGNLYGASARLDCFEVSKDVSVNRVLFGCVKGT